MLIISYQNQEVMHMRSQPPFNLVVHAPQSPENRISLSQQIASAHAQAVCQYISNLNCPSSTKSRLIDSIRDPSR